MLASSAQSIVNTVPPSKAIEKRDSARPSVNTYIPDYATYLPPSPPSSRTPSPFSPAQFDSGLLSNSTGSSSTTRFRGAATPNYSSNGTSSALGSIALERSPSTSSSHLHPASMTVATHRIHGSSLAGDASSPNGSTETIKDTQMTDGSSGLGYMNGRAHPYPGMDGYPSRESASTPSKEHQPFINVNNLNVNSVLSKAGDLIKSQTARVQLPTHLPSAGNGPSINPLSSSTSSFGAHGRRKSVAQALTPSISSVRFMSLCALWYTSSALSSNTGKTILNHYRYPVTLTFIQFGFVAGWCVLFCVGRTKLAQLGLMNGGNTHGNHSHSRALSVAQLHAASGWGIKKPTRKHLEGTIVMSLFQVAGHIFSSMAIARVPVSTVHTIKALSPLFTVLSYYLLFRVRYSINTWISLLPLTLGVMLACSFELRANAAGFLCALGSTLVFVSQNIFSKKLLPKDGGSHHDGGDKKLDKLHLLLYSSGIAFLGMIPLWAYYDGYSMLFGSAPVTRDASASRLAFYFTLNGSVHFLQNLLAFSILSLTSPVTYSIASLIKRIAVIIMAIIWFGQTIYPIQGIGISLTFLGLWMYNQAKGDVAKGENIRSRVERRNSVLLPTTKEDIGLGLDGNASGKGWSIVN